LKIADCGFEERNFAISASSIRNRKSLSLKGEWINRRKRREQRKKDLEGLADLPARVEWR
jgi:hypothetical protein